METSEEAGTETETRIITGNDLVFGNDFDHSIKNQLPYGFSVGYKILTVAIDPSIFGDVYSEKPYLYGPALTSFNKINATPITPGSEIKRSGSLPDSETLQGPESGQKEEDSLEPMESATRRKYFLNESHRKSFKYEPNMQYDFDFFTPYLDMGNKFGIRLPGFTYNVESYAGGQPLRYTLKNFKTGEVYLVVVLKLQRENDTAE